MEPTIEQKLGELPPDASVLWCLGCGHIHASHGAKGHRISTRLQSGKDCLLTISHGTPAECLAAFAQ